MEMRHCLRVATEDYAFYEKQRSDRKRRCVDNVVLPTLSDLRFCHNLQLFSRPTSINTYALLSSE